MHPSRTIHAITKGFAMTVATSTASLAAGALARRITGALVLALALTACATMEAQQAGEARADRTTAQSAGEAREAFRKDREAILSMAGNYRVTFDFRETVALAEGYELKAPKLSGGDEVVRVLEDRGDFISMQHILVVGGDEKFPVKHWRQDWIYEPESVLVFVGGNAWEKRPLSPEERKGKWAQIVYQVDDAPRYGALAAWEHENGNSSWTPPAEWRPLPRRDATTRDDYHAIKAVNRHVITPDGWVHEQDNTKLVLDEGEPYALAREVGVNTYRRFDAFDVSVAENYWAETAAYWAAVREEWTRMETENEAFAITLVGEPEELYFEILGLAEAYRNDEKPLAEASADARGVIADYTETDIGSLGSRLNRPSRTVSANADAAGAL